MKERKIKFPVPPVATVRRELAASVAETQYLRRLLRLSKEAEEARRLRREEAGRCQ